MRKDYEVVELTIDDSMAGAAIMILPRQLMVDNHIDSMAGAAILILPRQLIIILILWQGQPWLLSKPLLRLRRRNSSLENLNQVGLS